MRNFLSASLATIFYATQLLTADQENTNPSESTGDTVETTPKSELRYREEWPSIALHRTPEWYADAKFGIYTHWGPPVTATQYQTTEWYGWAMYNEWETYWTNAPRDGKKTPAGTFKWHKEKWGDQNEFGYKDFIKLFQPTKFDADEWADLFQKAGAKFAGPVAVHHDNFMMWDSDVTRWNVKKTTGIDVCGDLEKAIRKRGMKFVMTFHHAFSWWFFAHSYKFDGGVPGNEDLYCRPHKFSDQNHNFNEYPDEEYEELWFKKLEEACEKHSPDLIWFDMGLELLSDRIRKKAFARLLNMADERKQQIGITYKVKYDLCIPPTAGILNYEKGRSTVIRDDIWETDTTLGGWYYNGRKSRSADAVIEMLVDIVSKNGCLLLNTSPKPDGTIPEDQKQTLLAVGKWLKTNGEAIYNTRPWVIAEDGPTSIKKVRSDGFNENWEAIYTEKDFRFTRSKDNNTLYVTVLGKPVEGTTSITKLADIYPYLDRDITKVSLLGAEGDIEWKRDNKGLHLSFPENAQGEYAWCYKLSLAPAKE